jgi:hypothetical protein
MQQSGGENMRVVEKRVFNWYERIYLAKHSAEKTNIEQQTMFLAVHDGLSSIIHDRSMWSLQCDSASLKPRFHIPDGLVIMRASERMAFSSILSTDSGSSCVEMAVI